MKRVIVILFSLFLLVGCTEEIEIIEENVVREEDNIEEDTYEEESSYKEEVVYDNNGLLDPVVEWCQLYNPNGFNTVTCVISNPNKVDIDIIYELAFYKDGKEIYRTDDEWTNYQVSNKHNDIVWGNSELPNPNEVDDIKMVDIKVSKATNTSISANIKYKETKDGKAYFTVKSDKKPNTNIIWILEYKDLNKNKKCDKGELVVVEGKYTFEKETTIDINANLYEHDSYEIYYNAY